MFAIGWQYLCGRAVAADIADRDVPEWPPHPDRVFQALVAAWGEGGGGEPGRAALRWLEALDPPRIAAPQPSDLSGSETVYVPVNDLDAGKAKKYGDKLFALLPAHRRRAERRFPGAVLGDAVCALIWPDAEPGPHLDTLARLCAEVTSLGHSRSLVRAWVEAAPPPATWGPADAGLSGENLRVPHPGRLAALEEAYAGGVKGRSRPPEAPWRRYRRADSAPGAARGAFDPRLVILRRVGGERPGLLQAAALAEALRATLLRQVSAFPAAATLVSGHGADRRALDRTHLALLPLADVGHTHADGHLLGLALALPADPDPDEEQALFCVLAAALDPETETLRLVAGHAGACDLVVEDRPAPPLALRPATWTRAALRWASVTPLVLDHLPPRGAERDRWVEAQIVRACVLQGLPAPTGVAVLPVSHLAGAPVARAFAPALRKPDGARRWHTHAVLEFPVRVAGPLVLGAGRYRGLGLCRPLEAP